MREKRKARRPPDALLALEDDYRFKKKDLRRAINKTKAVACRDLIKTIDENPWGLLYRLVMNRLRQSSPSFSELIEPNVLDRLVDGLFPGGSVRDEPACCQGWKWNDDWSISYAEVFELLKKRDSNNAAPGPDVFKSTLWKKVPSSLVNEVTICYNTCLKEGVFPEIWKRANLVLIPKETGGITGGLPKVRPICLLDEIGKTFEKVIADRLTERLDENTEVNLSDNQFGFRKQRSTCDALNEGHDHH